MAAVADAKAGPAKPGKLTPYEIELVKDCWKSIEGDDKDACEFLGVFYKRFLDENPSYRPMFKGDSETQQRKLGKMFARVAQHSHRINEIIPQLMELGKRHQAYGVQPSYFVNMRNCFTWALAMVLKEKFTEDMRSAWVKCFDAISFFIIEGMLGKNPEMYSKEASESGDSEASVKSAASSLSSANSNGEKAKDKEKEKASSKEDPKKKKECVIQ